MNQEKRWPNMVPLVDRHGRFGWAIALCVLMVAGPAAQAQSVAPSAAEPGAAKPPSTQATGSSTAPKAKSAQALKALTHEDAAQRRAALVWLGDHGLHLQAIQLAPLLKDDDRINRQLAEQAMWQMWGRSGDARIDRQFAKAVSQMNEGDFAAAIEAFSHLIKAKPNLAEAWNKRATAYFLAGDFDKSLADCDEVIKRNPVHFGALAGYGQIYTQRGDYERALDYFNQALEVNPNMTGVQINIRGLMRLIDERRKNST
jgi:tetratricopeptide (TPR) repeat protein